MVQKQVAFGYCQVFHANGEEARATTSREACILSSSRNRQDLAAAQKEAGKI